jgi:UDP-MurNAc hydroxylase
LRVTFLSQTGFVAEHQGRRFLMDPWLTDGAFEGAWYHYPPQRIRAADLGRIDGLFISHLHGDHCDPAVLAQLDKSVPVFILDRRPNFLERYLRQRGFHDLRKVRAGDTVGHGPWQITLFEPFVGHDYFEARVGNLIDSSILLRAGGSSFLNFTDNFPTPEAAARLARDHGPFTFVAIPYNGAGDYPASCQSLADDEKCAERERLVARNLDTLAAVAAHLGAETLFPASAEYVLAGALAAKNRFLLQASTDQAVAHLIAAGYAGRIVSMREGSCLDLAGGTLEQTLAAPDVASREAFGDGLRSVRFAYEGDPPVTAAELRDRIIPALREARANLWTRQSELGFFSDWRTFIALGDHDFAFRWNERETSLVPAGQTKQPYLRFALDPRLLRRLLDGRAHWNNAAVGCHVDFWRAPNIYNPDLVTMMSFLHPLPAAKDRRQIAA